MKSASRVLLSRFAALRTEQVRRIEVWAAVAITFFIAIVHLLLLSNRGPLWRDEISSLSLATQPTWSRFWQALALDPCPPTFFVVLRGWSAMVGHSDLALRTVGCLIGFACLGALWLNARLTRGKTPILALLLLGASPTLIIWGDSLRGYGLGAFAAILCFTFYWRIIAQPTRLNVAGALLASTLAAHSLFIDSLIVFACAVAAATIAVRRRLWPRAVLVLAIGAVTALSLLPYLGLFRQTSEWASLMRINFSLLASLRILDFALLGHWRLSFWLWVVLLCLAAVATVRRGKASTSSEVLNWSDLSRYGLVAAAIAFTATMAFFRVVGWGTNVWYYLPMLTIVALAIDTALDSEHLAKAAALWRSTTAIVALAITAPLLLKASEIRATNLDYVANLVAKHATPDDLVVVWPGSDGITFNRYFDHRVPWITIPKAPNLPAQPGDDILAPFREPNSLRPTLAQVEATLRNGGRVWLASTWPLEIPEGQPRPVLPLEKNNPRSVGYFLRGWGHLLAVQMRLHAKETYRVALPQDQPVSVYEHSHVTVFAGWK